MMKSAEIRRKFLTFFEERGHQIVPSSPLIPAHDPSLLFTNAGMVQFKEVFLGLEQRPYKRATSAQRCVRAGGKHNDLENVGYTARHHTFFEMLGNFSFGDYFKREAIQFAWTFVTEVLGIPQERLWVTVFKDDDESAAIWLDEIKVSPHRFSRCGEEDNFWSMGDTGPCGPCTEIFYDHGPDIAGGPPGSPEQEGDRYVEIWNLVFMQYDRSATGELTHLPKPSVDTGLGLERVAAVMQGVHDNYDIDLFQSLIKVIAALAKVSDHHHTSLKVIADHIRSCAFLIADGVIPSNEGRGYVLRRIIRRAIRHGNKLGLTEPFFYQLVGPLAQEMGEAYPELIKLKQHIEKTLLQEEEQFNRTLEQGLKILEQDLAELSGQVVPGETIFKLYDTYGFPVDLTGDVAREKGLTLDIPGFEHAMQQQRALSQASSRFAASSAHVPFSIEEVTEFTGYQHLKHEAQIVAIIRDEQPVETLRSGEHGAIVLKRSPFYAESGGQVGDSGQLVSAHAVFKVSDTQKADHAYLHVGCSQQGELHVGDTVDAQVNIKRRQSTMLNHSATHLLHAALRQILGEHVLQKGSLVAPDRLRFDFSHYEALTANQISEIEHVVNQKIRENLPVSTALMSADQAQQSGAIALFGEKYGDEVRVLSMGNFSKELCSGTHVAHTGEIGFFKIIAATGIAAGVRRIEAITGQHALDWAEKNQDYLSQATALLKTEPAGVVAKVQQLLADKQQLEKKITQFEEKLAKSHGVSLLDQVQTVADLKVLAVSIQGANAKTLRVQVDELKQKLGKAVIVLVGLLDHQMHVVAGVSRACIDQVPSAVTLVQMICGKGGGRNDLAQGGGKIPPDLENKLATIKEKVADYYLQQASKSNAT